MLAKWTKEACVEDAKKYKTKLEWAKSNGKPYWCGPGYVAARRNGWLDECCGHMSPGRRGPPPLIWTKEACVEEAKKYKTKSKWKREYSSCYEAARRNGWLSECCKHMTPERRRTLIWTKEACVEEAKKYKTRTEWKRKNSASHETARRNDWLNECCKHMFSPLRYPNVRRQKGWWTKEACVEDAKKYKTKLEWQKNGKGYRAAQKNGWLKECCKHMPKHAKHNTQLA